MANWVFASNHSRGVMHRLKQENTSRKNMRTTALVEVARHLRQVSGHFLDARTNFRGDISCDRNVLLVAGNNKVGFVEGKRLDQVCMLCEDFSNLRREAGRDK
jgi:hypothetical protein